MANALAHRGPDDDSVVQVGAATLGACRLSILDPTPAGRQSGSTCRPAGCGRSTSLRPSRDSGQSRSRPDRSLTAHPPLRGLASASEEVGRGGWWRLTGPVRPPSDPRSPSSEPGDDLRGRSPPCGHHRAVRRRRSVDSGL